MLAVCHAVGVNALIEEEIATFLAEQLLAHYPQALTKRYGLDVSDLDGVGVLEGIAQRRGFRMRGGDFDLEKTALAFLQDFRTGALGRISLETPERREVLLQQQPSMSPDALAPEAADNALE
jgi:ribosome biogenesis GTPase A